MSEYQYYEFLAIDHPLDEADREALRELSSRARITATSFTNHYEWGDFRGDPKKLMERCFDLHLYLANWGTRRLVMRFPKRLLDRKKIDAFLREIDWVEIWDSGENLIVDICRDEVEADYDDWDDGSSWLAMLLPLRADVLAGDLRLFYVLWLSAVHDDRLPDADAEPLPGLGPLTGALEAVADFFGIDADLVAAAAEQPFEGDNAAVPADAKTKMLKAMPEGEKSEFLLRVIEGDPHVAIELKRHLRQRCQAPPVAMRTAGHLRERAGKIRDAREWAAAEKRKVKQRRQAREAEKAYRARLDALERRGETVWREIENEIQRRNGPGYDRAAGLLADLKVIAKEQGTLDDFVSRLVALRERHGKKGRLIERLRSLDGE
jgi:hypothetical protein